MHIHGIHQIHGAHSLKGPHAPGGHPHSGAGPARQIDRLDISPAAQAASQGAAAGEVRADLVAQLRVEIASGTYETPDKLERAVDRLFDAIG